MSLDARIIALAQAIGADIKALISGKVDKTGSVSSVAGRAGAVVLAKADVGLGNADNTADNFKPLSAPQATAILANSRRYNGGVTNVNANRTLLVSEAGTAFRLTATAAITITLPDSGSQPPAGMPYTLRNESLFPVTVVATGIIYSAAGAQGTSFTLGANEWIEISSNSSSWVINARGRLDAVAAQASIPTPRSWVLGFSRFSTSQVLTAAQAGRIIWFTLGGLTCQLPTPSTMTPGQSFTIRNGNTGVLTLTNPGGGSIYVDVDASASTSTTLGPREWIELSTDGANWVINARGTLDKGLSADNPNATGSFSIGTAPDGASPVVITGGLGATLRHVKTATGGQLDIDDVPFTNTDQSAFRFHRNITTSGVVSVTYHRGNNSTAADHILTSAGTGPASSSTAVLSRDGGKVAVATPTVDATATLLVNGAAKVAGPLSLGPYTLTTLPSAATYSGYYITVTNATGGAKLCYSNGINWLIANTTTIVS